MIVITISSDTYSFTLTGDDGKVFYQGATGNTSVQYDPAAESIAICDAQQKIILSSTLYSKIADSATPGTPFASLAAAQAYFALRFFRKAGVGAGISQHISVATYAAMVAAFTSSTTTVQYFDVTADEVNGGGYPAMYAYKWIATESVFKLIRFVPQIAN